MNTVVELSISEKQYSELENIADYYGFTMVDVGGDIVNKYICNYIKEKHPELSTDFALEEPSIKKQGFFACLYKGILRDRSLRRSEKEGKIAKLANQTNRLTINDIFSE